MVISQRSKGVNSVLELSPVTDSTGYEIEMLTQNEFEFIPSAMRGINGNDVSLSYKVDGLGSLDKLFSRRAPNMRDVKKILSALYKCIEEIKCYLLNVSNILLSLKYIFYDKENDKLRFIYAPDSGRDFYDSLRKLLEDIMQIYDHEDRDGVVFLYDFYSEILKENFSPRMFCEIIEKKKLNSAGKKALRDNSLMIKEDSQEKNDRVNKYRSLNEDSAPIKNSANVDVRETAENKKDKGMIKKYAIVGLVILLSGIPGYFLLGGNAVRFTAVVFVLYLAFVIYKHITEREDEEDIAMAESGYLPDDYFEARNASGNRSIVATRDTSGRGSIVATRATPVRGSIVATRGTSGRGSIVATRATPGRGSIVETRDTSGRENIVEMRSISGNEGLVTTRKNPVKERLVRKLVPVISDGTAPIMVSDVETNIGRSMKECDYLIDEPGISRRHARLLKKDGETLIEDLGSTNGTYINNRRISKNNKVVLKIGDTVSMAGVEFYCV